MQNQRHQAERNCLTVYLLKRNCLMQKQHLQIRQRDMILLKAVRAVAPVAEAVDSPVAEADHPEVAVVTASKYEIYEINY